MPLTPLGARTLEGFKKRYGGKDGETKFRSAIDKGLIDGTKMESKAGGSKALQSPKVEAAPAPAKVELSTPEPEAGGSTVGVQLARNASGSFQARPG